MTDKKIAVEGQPNDQSITGSEEPSVGGGKDMVYDSGIFIADVDPDEIQYGTRIDAPLVAGAKAGDDWPVAYTNQLQGAFQQFADKAHRDKWTSMYKSRLFNTIAVVGKGENDYPSIYHWTGKQKDGSDGSWEFAGYFGGVVLADADGAIPALRATIVLGEDFSIQAAGDNGLGALVQISDKLKAKLGGGDGLISVGTYQKPSTFGKGSALEFEWPLKAWVDASKNPDGSANDAFRVSMEHGLWQLAQAPNYLAYLDANEEVIGKAGDHKSHKSRIWCGDVICPAGAYIQIDRPNKRIGLQEADDKDPNISGGMDYYVAFFASPVGIAPNNGFVRAFVYDDSNDKFAEDLNGHPLATQVNYNRGAHLKPSGNPLLVVGLVNEKGIDFISTMIEDNFKDDNVVLGDKISGPTGIMIQAVTGDSKSGDAFRQFELDTGIKLMDKIKWVSSKVASFGWVLQLAPNEAMTTISAGDGQAMNDGWQLHSLTSLSVGTVDGHLVIKDSGNIADFYLGKIESSEDTEMMRGHVSKATLVCKDRVQAVQTSLVYWDGESDNFPRVFDSRNNMSPVLNKGWHIVKTIFEKEQVDGADHSVTGTGTVPPTAKNYGWISYPIGAQSPTNIAFKDLSFGAETPFNGFVSRRPIFPSERAIEYNDEKGVFAQDNDGFASLRYTLTPAPDGLPLPCGELKAGALDIEIDKTVNVVNGSSATGGEGALKFKNDGTFHNYYWYNQNGKREKASSYFMVYPGEKLADGQSCTVKLWWAIVSADGNTYTKIDTSETTHTVKHGDMPQVVMMEEWSQDFEGADRIALRGNCSISDGAYLMCTRKDKPLVNNAVEYKEIVTVS